MSAANPLIAPTTAGATITYNAITTDAVILATTGTGLAGAETVTIKYATTNGTTQYISPYTNTAVGLTAALQSIVLPGGVVYSITQSATVGACGLDVLAKPRIF